MEISESRVYGAGMTDVMILAAKRSPIGKLEGALSLLDAAQIGAQVARDVLSEAEIDPAAVDDVIIGQVLQAGAGQNPARQTALTAGIPVATPAMTLNQVCGAGQRSMHVAAQAITAGDASLILAGGQDSMSRAPHAVANLRGGVKAGDVAMRDLMVIDGLWDAFHDVHMGTTVERLAQTRQISRANQDEFAARSHAKALAAIEAGAFDGEITAIDCGSGDLPVRADEAPRKTSTEALAAMPAVFEPNGTITAGNASGLNDGAAMVLVANARRADELGIEPMARIAGYASHGVAPMDMGLGPVGASRRALERAGWQVSDLDAIEVNEAFAAQALAVEREMGWDPDRVNRRGGAIALGHPLAGSGARIVVTLLHRMKDEGARRGLATLCIGGGMGVAICLEAD